MSTLAPSMEKKNINKLSKIIVRFYRPGCIGGDETGVVDQGEEYSFQQLNHDQGPGYSY